MFKVPISQHKETFQIHSNSILNIYLAAIIFSKETINFFGKHFSIEIRVLSQWSYKIHHGKNRRFEHRWWALCMEFCSVYFRRIFISFHFHSHENDFHPKISVIFFFCANYGPIKNQLLFSVHNLYSNKTDGRKTEDSVRF